MDGWHPDGTGVEDAGDVGGDIQVGPAWSVRYVNDAKPCSLITVTVYAVDHNIDNPQRHGEEYAWQRQVEFLTCTDPADPGGTEVWSDVVYEDSYFGYETQAKAEAEARGEAERLATPQAAEIHEWDGEPDYR